LERLTPLKGGGGFGARINEQGSLSYDSDADYRLRGSVDGNPPKARLSEQSQALGSSQIEHLAGWTGRRRRSGFVGWAGTDGGWGGRR
jgi:hypothetical protein